MNCNRHLKLLQQDACPKIPGLANFLRPGQIILLGEIHGTQEAPFEVEQMACQALRQELSVTIGLELPRSDQAVIDTFLNSQGSLADKKQILGLSFWADEYQDGRTSQAMFELLEAIRILKAKAAPIQVLLIDQPAAEDRDAAMAQRIIEHVTYQPRDFVIILTGNFHNMIFENSGQMGRYLLDKYGSDKVLSLRQEYVMGSAWVDVAGEGFGPVGLRGQGKAERGIFLDSLLEEYHGTFEMDTIHYSRPAKNMFDH